MQLPYFYEKTIPPSIKTFILSEETSKHCIQVLRMKQGDKLQLTNGCGTLYTASIIEPNKKNAIVSIDDCETFTIKAPSIFIGISPLKNANRFEWFLEKAVEIGVVEILPIICKRTEKVFAKQERWQGILISAMLQSRQVWLPILQPNSTINTIIETNNTSIKYIAHCEEEEGFVKKLLAAENIEKDVLILIGPEGDFTNDEIQKALNNRFLPISLGNTRLRSETAAIVALTTLNNTINIAQ